MPNKSVPTGDRTGYPFPPDNPPPSSGFAPAPKGDDGPLPDRDEETK